MKQPSSSSLNQIKAKLQDSELTERFFKLIDRCESVDAGKFVDEVDNSDYSLEDWAEAFLGFDQWLTKQGISGRDFSAMLGYLICCQMMIVDNVDRPNLQSFVDQVLTEYGFDPDHPVQT